MKILLFLITLLCLASAQETPEEAPKVTKNCMYCKRLDSQASFLYPNSYCAATDECLADEMNYINRWCKSKWVDAWMLDIDKDCGAKKATRDCSNFVSKPELVGTEFQNET